MPLTSKLRLRYLRRIGFPGYSHLELEIEEEIIMEEGDVKDEVAAMVFSSQGHLIKQAMQPVVNLYKTTTGAQPVVVDSPASELQAQSEASKKAYEQKQVAQAAAGQPTLDDALDENIPGEREPARAIPVYSKEGKRLRGVGQKSFRVAEITVAWQALAEAKVVDTTPDDGRSGNENRRHIREWLKMTPLDPGFSVHELNIVVASYDKWRGQGLTTSEAMLEVGNDYIGVFGGSGTVTGEIEGTGEVSEGDEVEDQSDDQAPDGDQQQQPTAADIDPNEQAGGEDAGPDDGTAKAEAE